MKDMKKFIALITVLVLALCSFCACGTDGSGQNTDNGDATVDTGITFTDADLDDTVSDAYSVVFSDGYAEADNCDVDGTVVTITKAGTYLVSGSCSDGQLIVNAKNCEVKIALNGLNLTCGNSAPIFVQKAEKAVLTLCENTVNYLTDTGNYVLNEDEEPTATVFSKSDLTINGSGTLIISANYNNGIQCKDVLKIAGGVINLTSVDDGIIGKDFLRIKNSAITVVSEGDGIRVTNDGDTALGTVCVDSGVFDLTCGTDGIQAANGIVINGGEFKIATGGGSANSSSDPAQQNPWGSWGGTASGGDSAKALKAANALIISGGSFVIDSSDDSVHSNGAIAISGGEFEISSGDDGFHADSTLTISGADITVLKCYEGIESVKITVSGGTIEIAASDDGFNAAGGNDQSSVGRPGQNPFGDTSDASITISGGVIKVKAAGDGIDSNGDIYMTGGYVTVEGPTDSGNGSIDYQNQFKFTGGTLLALGSSGMAQMPSQNSSCYSVMINLDAYTSASLKITDSDGNAVLEYLSSKKFSNIVFASDTLEKGAYTLYLNGTEITDFTISSVLTTVGSQGGAGGGPGGGPSRP